MANEQVFRWLFIAIFVSMLSISGYFRRKARQAGEAIPRAREGKLVLLSRLLSKEKHVLIAHGPYRWVRHPLYAAATMSLVALSVLAANWFMLAMACAAFLGIAGLVIPREEAKLRQKFGDDYREYVERTGRFAPRPHFFQ